MKCSSYSWLYDWVDSKIEPASDLPDISTKQAELNLAKQKSKSAATDLERLLINET